MRSCSALRLGPSHRIASLLQRQRRLFSTRHLSHERVAVRCGSGGHVTIDLFNVSKHSPQSTLIVHLPAFPSTEGTSWHQIPNVFHDWPVASINYRWDNVIDRDAPGKPTQWPAPIHDTAFAYSWILENLAPPRPKRRNMHVFGSYLGASPATSLALTESHTHAQFGVRSFLAYNGIYNWTMFLPEHPIHRRKTTKGFQSLDKPTLAEGAKLERLRELIPDLFRHPSNLFDPFASSSLFFHNPGLHVPSDFNEPRSQLSSMVDLLTGQGDDAEVEEPPKPPRKSHLVFPPRASTLKIPPSLLLYDKHVVPPPKGKRKAKRKAHHTFETQADELAELMRRSVEKVELKERSKWDEEGMEGWDEDVALRRVQMLEVEEDASRDEFADLNKDAQEQLYTWLQEQEGKN